MRKIHCLLFIFVGLVLFYNLIFVSAQSNVKITDYGKFKKIEIITYDNSLISMSQNLQANNKEMPCYNILGIRQEHLPINVVVNPRNNDALSEDFVLTTLENSMETWNDAIKGDLFGNYSVNYSVNFLAQNYRNTINFYRFPGFGIVAQTTLYIDSYTLELFEFDILINDNYDFGDAELRSDVIDLQSLLIHELGHGLGLGDLFRQECSYVTMYSPSYEGDTYKRTLEKEDKKALKMIYLHKEIKGVPF